LTLIFKMLLGRHYFNVLAKVTDFMLQLYVYVYILRQGTPTFLLDLQSQTIAVSPLSIP